MLRVQIRTRFLLRDAETDNETFYDAFRFDSSYST